MRCKALGILLLAMFIASCLNAQDGTSMLMLDHSRQNDFTFSTLMDFRYRLDQEKYELDVVFHHDNIFNRSLADDRFVQIYLNSSIWQYWHLKDKLEAASWIETDQYLNSLNQKLSFYGGVRFRPNAFVQVTPLIGYSFDQRSGNLDQGISPALRVDARYKWESGLYLRTGGFARYKQIRPRRQRNVHLFHFWGQQFQENVQLEMGLEGGTHELDDYFSQSIKRIISDSLNPTLNLNYAFSPKLTWESRNRITINQRLFRYDRLNEGQAELNDLSFRGIEVNTAQRLSWVSEKLRAYGLYEYLYGTRIYQLDNNMELNETEYEKLLRREKEKDFLKKQHRLDFSAQFRPKLKHGLEFRLTNQYLQYDTPSEINTDDRDELSYVGSVKWKGSWKRNFFTSWGLSGNYRHYAFLFKEKSQDNYKQRSLRMDFGYGWNITPKVRLEGDNAVYVTYNVKDFTDFNKTDRSTRNLETNFKLFYRPGRKFSSQLDFNRKEVHQSYLNWEAFTETTLDTINFLTISNQNRYFFQKKGSRNKYYADIGYKHFNQNKRFKAGMVTLENELVDAFMRQINLQTGPVLALGFRGKGNSTLDISCWLQSHIRRFRFRKQDTYSLLGSTYYERDAQKVEREFRPYLSVKMNYFFK